MRRWWASLWSDTLSKRLFLLLWATLVASHLLGFWLARPPQFDPQHEPGRRPALEQGADGQHGPPPRPGELDGEPHGNQVGPLSPSLRTSPGPGPGPDRPGPPASDLWRVFLASVVLLGAAAWFGARWLTRPMRQLAQAAAELGQSLGQAQSTHRADRQGRPLLDDQQGPLEVRQTAQSFNDMARRLRDQFDDRGLLMGAVSHDLRTPLTRLRMRLERLRPDPIVERCVSDIHDINALIEAVLDALNEERSQEATVSMDVLSLVQAMADDLVEAGQSVDAGGEPGAARLQPVALKRVLDNLISNAIRYGGHAQITVSSQARCMVITVDDSGPGIPQTMLESVFKPFVRLDASRNRDTGGVGLGLYIARELTLRQGGSLVLSNRPEGGLRATLSLPKAD